ncbi:MAG: SDR family oxidoreductase [Proteobacteria bacterium]|nr:SDR family oxidoreductase [Pseudomonadota bacterium]
MPQRNRAALVTGSGRNIGRSAALALVKMGCNIAVNGSSDRAACERVADEARTLGVKAEVIMGDVGDMAAATAIGVAAVKAFGGIDILVNNAAIRPMRPFLETDEKEWQRVLAVDLHAARWLAKVCLPGMIERGWGRIINFAGMNAIQGYNGRAPVSVSKHGVWGLTKALAKEFAKQGITVNIISPGPIQPDEADPDMRAHIEGMVTRVPMGRIGANDEIGAAVAFLASDGAAFMTGQMLQVNGGAET